VSTVPRTVAFADGSVRGALGLGTWKTGETARGSRTRADEVAAVRRAIEIGYRTIDTAEMYGEGGAEEVVGEAIAGALAAGDAAREDLFVVSKVYPHNATAAGVAAACDRSRARLGLDRIDLYLLHWRGSVPLAATLAGFERLRAAERIGAWGVSNFDVDDLEALVALDGGGACAANQVWWSLGERGPEVALVPWQRARGMPAMAYSPIDQGALAGGASPLAPVAARLGCTTAQLALAALLAEPGAMPIPKAVRAAHLQENWDAQALVLSAEDRAAIDRACPRPRRKPPLAMN
jgi:diketogulonate reductase-like aldo/keto reductase